MGNSFKLCKKCDVKLVYPRYIHGESHCKYHFLEGYKCDFCERTCTELLEELANKYHDHSTKTTDAVDIAILEYLRFLSHQKENQDLYSLIEQRKVSRSDLEEMRDDHTHELFNAAIGTIPSTKYNKEFWTFDRGNKSDFKEFHTCYKCLFQRVQQYFDYLSVLFVEKRGIVTIEPVMDCLSNDVFGVILSFLSFPRDFSALMAVNKSWNKFIVNSDLSWVTEVNLKDKINHSDMFRQKCDNISFGMRSDDVLIVFIKQLYQKFSFNGFNSLRSFDIKTGANRWNILGSALLYHACSKNTLEQISFGEAESYSSSFLLMQKVHKLKKVVFIKQPKYMMMAACVNESDYLCREDISVPISDSLQVVYREQGVDYQQFTIAGNTPFKIHRDAMGPVLDDMVVESIGRCTVFDLQHESDLLHIPKVETSESLSVIIKNPDIDIFQLLHQNCPRIKELKLKRLTETNLKEVFEFPLVTSLVLTKVPTTISTLERVFAYFPNLISLEIDANQIPVTMIEQVSKYYKDSLQYLCLTRLNIVGSQPLQAPLPLLRTLVVNIVVSHDTQKQEDYIEFIANNFRHVTELLFLCLTDKDKQFVDAVTKACKSLKTYGSIMKEEIQDNSDNVEIVLFAYNTRLQ
jgi:hypothetical protein